VNKQTLEKIFAEYRDKRNELRRRIIVCGGTGCIANGSQKVADELVRQLTEEDIKVDVKLDFHECTNHTLVSMSGCQGFCQVGPLLSIEPDGILYTHVKESDVNEIVERTIKSNEVIDRLLYVNPTDQTHCKGYHEIPFYNQQSRTVLAACGNTDPEDIREYISNQGYYTACEVFNNLDSIDICRIIESSGLRGRGGGGFPTGTKWRYTLAEKSAKKYVICNGDEGDPGAFMDRSILEGNPHSVIEGMMIAGRAIGADEGYIYVRAEYPLAIKRMRVAINDAEELGILGDNVFESGYNFKLHIMEGAGAFVCGEETALIASIEGQRGMPRPKPPYPAQKGLFGKPTVINNVETLSGVAQIIRMGAEAYRRVGTEKSPGTKTFALTGHVANTGLIEVPFGSTVRDIVFKIGGGVTNDAGEIDNNAFKAVQIGGPSGGCLTKAHLDVPLDFDSLKSIDAMVGSGGLVVMNDSTCIVKIARFFMKFTTHESCGKCVPCREGTRQMLNLLDDIIEGRGTLETLDMLEELGNAIKLSSLCGLGKSAPSPVLSTLKHFREEYEAHVVDKKCPTRQCKALSPIEIDPDKCKGCTLCAKICPVGAISGIIREPHTIDPDKCIQCGACKEKCRFGAIN
jgi:NADH-quinone oxidoreductase subunit F